MLQFPPVECQRLKTRQKLMKYVLSSVPKGNKTHDKTQDGVKWLCEIKHTAGLLNSE